VNYVSSIAICLPASQGQIKQFVAQYTRTEETFNWLEKYLREER